MRDAAKTSISHYIDTHSATDEREAAEMMLKREQRSASLRATAAVGPDGERDGEFARRSKVMTTLGQEVLVAQRNTLIAERDAEHLDDDVMRTVLEQLDLQESFLNQWKPIGYAGSESVSSVVSRRRSQPCRTATPSARLGHHHTIAWCNDGWARVIGRCGR